MFQETKAADQATLSRPLRSGGRSLLQKFYESYGRLSRDGAPPEMALYTNRQIAGGEAIFACLDGVTDRLTLEGQLLGTAAFMSPEQGAGEHVDGRSDLYSLGGVGFYALTGRAPFEATTLEAVLVARFTRAAPAVASIRPDVPSALAATIDRCLAREPHDRFASGEAVAEALSEGTGIAGTQEVAPPVRSFLRA